MFLLEIFKQLSKELTNVVLLLVGDGELREDIENRISALGLQNSVKLLGNRNDVPQLLQMADCFLFPSAWEGLPVTVVEAQAAGLPCFISDRITKDVVLSDLVTGLPVDKGTDCWVEQLKNADLSSRNVMEAVRKNGYDIYDSASWLAGVYKELAVGNADYS